MREEDPPAGVVHRDLAGPPRRPGILDGGTPHSMIRSPRPRSIPRAGARAGLALRGTPLLAVTGGAAVLFLFFLLPQLLGSEAAERRAPSELLPPMPADEVEQPVEPGVLTMAPEAGELPPPGSTTAGSTMADAALPTGAAAASLMAAGATGAPGAGEAPPPPLRFEKGAGAGRQEVVRQEEMRARRSDLKKKPDEATGEVTPSEPKHRGRRAAGSVVRHRRQPKEGTPPPGEKPPPQDKPKGERKR